MQKHPDMHVMLELETSKMAISWKMFDYIIQLPDEINRILQIYTEKKKEIKEALALAS